MKTTLEQAKKFNLDNIRKVAGGVPSNPRTIQEKLRWLNIYDIPWSEKYSMPLKSVCADKVLLHEYSKDVLGKDICVPIIKTYNSTSEINWNELPNKFVIKCNHGSGMNVIVKDKSKLNITDAKNKLNAWLKQDYAFRNGFESHYHWIDRKISVEQFMDDGTPNCLTDYKFYCMNGEPKFIHVINDRFTNNMHFSFYDLDFNKMALEQTNHPKSVGVAKKPGHLNEMIEIARKLSKPFKFVRVDLYEIGGVVYLGELTYVPDVGVFHYKHKEDELTIGALLKL